MLLFRWVGVEEEVGRGDGGWEEGEGEGPWDRVIEPLPKFGERGGLEEEVKVELGVRPF